MDWYEAEVRQLERSKIKHHRQTSCVAFYGSSTIRLWPHLKRDMEDSRVVNLGFGGSTLEACVFFFERLICPLEPCSLVVYAGDNDLGDGRKPQAVLASFQELAAKVQRVAAVKEFGYISIKPSPSRCFLLDHIRTANQLIRDEIETTGIGYFIDVFPAMLDEDGLPRPQLFQEDGLHMSADGYSLWRDQLSPFRDRILTRNCTIS
jgi:hypothetical protein